MKSFVPEQERNLVIELVLGKVDEHEFLRLFRGLPLERVITWLEQGVTNQDALTVELALHVGHRFGFSQSCLNWLHALASAHWHQRHEDVVDALLKLASAESVNVLFQTAVTTFTYRDYDESQSLGVKCIYGLGRIATLDAVARLRELTKSSDSILVSQATVQLHRLSAEAESDAVRGAATAALL